MVAISMVAIAPLFPQENARWSRVIYRQLDLTQEANAPLYYMKTTSGEQSSLFTMLFRLLQNDAIPRLRIPLMVRNGSPTSTELTLKSSWTGLASTTKRITGRSRWMMPISRATRC